MKRKDIYRILKIFENNPNQKFTFTELSDLVDTKYPKDKVILKNLLQKLTQNRDIQRDGNHYKSAKFIGQYTGIIEHINRNLVFVINKQVFKKDIRIGNQFSTDAIHGDKVRFVVYENKKNELRGRITKILKKTKREFVGVVIQEDKKVLWVQVLGKIYIPRMIIPIDNISNSAKCDDKVIVKLLKWTKKQNYVSGKILSILGKSGTHEVEMNSIILEFGLTSDFSRAIENETQKISSKITAQELKTRNDFREITTFTIDPDDAKDFDDALSVRLLDPKKNIWQVGIHIADVTHYIDLGSPIDMEARHRGTSVYLVDRTIHMLPEHLSTDICSLRPNEDKLTFSAVFEIDTKGNILKEWFGKTVIRSDNRFTYRQAQDVLEGKATTFSKELLLLNKIAKQLRKQRLDKDAIQFKSKELRVKLNDKKEVIDIVPRENLETNELIEEFMLLANKHVACFVNSQKHNDRAKTMIFRIHEPPNEEKVNNFTKFVKIFGYNISGEHLPKAINRLNLEIKGRNEQYIIENEAIKTMSKAIYSTDNQGHYGLGFQYYTHFTSPIRRYPDMMVHRLLADYLNKKISWEKQQIDDICNYCSQMERRAVDCERASIKLKQVEFIQSHIGQTFNGLVVGVNERRIFVELIEKKCEGVIYISDLKDDYYNFYSDKQQIIGKRKRRSIRLADYLLVYIKKIDLHKRLIYLDLVK